MNRALIGISLSPMIVVAHHIAVIRYEKDESIVIHTFVFQCLNDTPYLFVDKSNIGIIVSLGITDIFITEISVRGIRGSLFGIQPLCVSTAPIPYRRVGNIGVIIHIQKTLRRIIRTVGTGKRDFEEQRTVLGVIMADEIASHFAGPVSGV